jgi:hypothetical protein
MSAEIIPLFNPQDRCLLRGDAADTDFCLGRGRPYTACEIDQLAKYVQVAMRLNATDNLLLGTLVENGAMTASYRREFLDGLRIISSTAVTLRRRLIAAEAAAKRKRKEKKDV